jgi:hypothetical protein
MKKILSQCLLAFALLAPQMVWAQSAPPASDLDMFLSKEPTIPLMFLGAYHMANPGLDHFNLQSDDVLAPKRQAEIQDLVNRLAAFKPTKIAVEAPFGDSLTRARYQNYLAGKHTLSRSETEQIGFRLAKMLGHTEIYPIDVTGNFNMAALQKVVEADPAKHGPRMGQMQQMGPEMMALMGKWLSEGTVTDMLYQMNRQEFIDLNYQLYLRVFLPTVHGENYAGADLVGDWYHRNLRIMSNLHQIGCTPEDRVLIIYGQGHVPLFQRIAQDSPYFEVIDVLPYLKGN